MNCKHCVHNNDGHEAYCGKCNVNPSHKNEFKSTDSFYPLELSGNHICLWNENGDSKYTIALFEKDNDGCNDLRFIGDRPMDERVDQINFFALIELGFEVLNND